MFAVQTEWDCPEEFPNLSDAKFIAIDLETKDPDLKAKGSGAIQGHGEIVGIAVAVEGWSGYYPIAHEGGGNMDKRIVLETCPTSNIATKIYENYEMHPVKKLHDLGVRVTVNSDDPPFFNATIQGEYEAMAGIGFTENDLLSMTRNAIESSFLEEDKKNKILTKLD